MAYKSPRLTRRTVVLVKMESEPGVDPGPIAGVDAVLVGAPDFTVDPQVLKRDYYRADLSPLAFTVGRKLAGMKFELELRGNGFQHSGNLEDAPVLGRLLRACGMSEVAINLAATPGAVRQIGEQRNPVESWAITGQNTTNMALDYQVTVVASGASGVAALRVVELNGYEPTLLRNETVLVAPDSVNGTATVDATDPLKPVINLGGAWAVGDEVYWNIGGITGSWRVNQTDLQSIATGIATTIGSGTISGTAGPDSVTIGFSGSMGATVVTSGGTSLVLGTSGVMITPTFTGDLTLGSVWRISVFPPGISYEPVSVGQETCTIYMYMDGSLHKMTASQGTFSLSANAGDFGKLSFTFTGQYSPAVRRSLPKSITYDTPAPPTFQKAMLRAAGNDITIQALSFDIANTITPRDDVNSPDGYNGVRITTREPTGGIDPEITLPGDFDPWDALANATSMQFSCRFGQTPGNTVWLKGPNVQYSKVTYKDRNGLRTYDGGLGFAHELSDDEVRLHFC